VWKQNSYVKESELKHCITAINNFAKNYAIVDGLQEMSLADDSICDESIDTKDNVKRDTSGDSC